MEKEIPDRLTTLGHPQRLALFRLLMRRYPNRLPAGEIATVLGQKASTTSAYLSALQQVGLITQKRAGTSLLYSVDMTAVRQTFDFLFTECGRKRPDLLSPEKGPKPMTDQTYNVLFICTGNSARSIFAETLLRHAGRGRFNVYSAGTKPSSQLNPFAVELLASKGFDTSDLRAKNVEEFTQPGAPVFDFVFTVCDQAANEQCAAWSGQPISGHWGVPDPVKATGTDAEKSLAFQAAYAALKLRIEAFAALPFDSLDRIALQNAVDDIGREKDTEK